MRLPITTLLLIGLLAGCSRGAAPKQPDAQSQTPDAPSAIAKDIPAGDYKLDGMHASLLFRVDHLGFSKYTARFKRFDAKLQQFDPTNLATSSLAVTVDPSSIETDFPDPATIDFNAMLQSEQWLNVAQFPEIKYQSTSIAATGNNTARVTGDLTFRGVTKPVVLEATFNGGYAGHQMDPNARIGFSARGTMKRSEFGMGYGIPAPGTTMGVSDAVEIIIEVEFSGPPQANAAEPPATGTTGAN